MSNVIARTSENLSSGAYKDPNTLGVFTNLFPYKMYDSVWNNPVGGPLTVVKLAAGSTECPRGCDCKNIFINCDCSSPCGNEMGGGTNTNFLNLTSRGVGLFTLIITLPATPAYVGKIIDRVGFFVSATLNYGEQVVFTPTVNPNIWDVSTYNASGVLANQVLNNTVIAMKVYFEA